jgi:NOL1/NOP2/fmu family ribosome biogenesis protein
LQKLDGEEGEIRPYQSIVTETQLASYTDFCRDNLYRKPEGEFTIFGQHLYLTPPGVPDFGRLKVVRPGWYLGEFKKDRFEPAHGLAIGLQTAEVIRTLPLHEKAEIASYLRGETLERQGEKGWTLVSVDGFPLGWGKLVNGIVKNHYPRSMRWLF